MNYTFAAKKHTAIKTVLLHLLPGLVQLAVFILLIPVALRFGFNSTFADHLGTYVAMVPIQIGILLFIAKKTTGTYKITELMPFLEKSKLTEYLLFMVIILIWALGINAIFSPLENGLRDGLFSFVPDSIAMRDTDVFIIEKSKLVISPWYFFSRVFMMIPLNYWVMKRKNIRFSIMAHVVANVFASTYLLYYCIKV